MSCTSLPRSSVAAGRVFLFELSARLFLEPATADLRATDAADLVGTEPALVGQAAALLGLRRRNVHAGRDLEEVDRSQRKAELGHRHQRPVLESRHVVMPEVVPDDDLG